METLAVVLTAYLTFQLAATGGFKLIALTPSGQRWPRVMERQAIRDRLRVSPWLWNLTGLWEVALAVMAAAGLANPVLAVVAGSLAIVTMAGAIFFHARVGDSLAATLPALLELAVAVAVVALHLPRLGSQG